MEEARRVVMVRRECLQRREREREREEAIVLWPRKEMIVKISVTEVMFL